MLSAAGNRAGAGMHAFLRGAIRYLGVLLYDADRIHATAMRPDHELVDAQREMILDPFDPEVVHQAAEKRNRRCRH